VGDLLWPGDLALVTQREQLRARLKETTTRMSPEPKREVEAQYRALLDEARGRLQVRGNFAEMARLGVYATPMGPGSVAEYESELRAEVAYYFPLLRDDVAKMSAKQYGLLICGGAERTRSGRSG
jgi:hypothetical protein